MANSNLPLDFENAKEIENLSPSKISELTTQQILELTEAIEQFMLDELGEIDADTLYKYEEKNDEGKTEWEGKHLCDAYEELREALRNRLDAPYKGRVEEIDNMISDIFDSISDLKTKAKHFRYHRHDETGKVAVLEENL